MKTVSRAYDSYAQARAAVDAVEKAGVPAADVSIVANKYVSAEYADVNEVSDAAKGAGIGGALGGGAGLLAGLGLLAIPGLGPVVAAGWLASTAVGVAAGAATGGIVGALVDAGVDREHADVYSEFDPSWRHAGDGAGAGRRRRRGRRSPGRLPPHRSGSARS